MSNKGQRSCSEARERRRAEQPGGAVPRGEHPGSWRGGCWAPYEGETRSARSCLRDACSVSRGGPRARVSAPRGNVAIVSESAASAWPPRPGPVLAPCDFFFFFKQNNLSMFSGKLRYLNSCLQCHSAVVLLGSAPEWINTPGADVAVFRKDNSVTWAQTSSRWMVVSSVGTRLSAFALCRGETGKIMRVAGLIRGFKGDIKGLRNIGPGFKVTSDKRPLVKWTNGSQMNNPVSHYCYETSHHSRHHSLTEVFRLSLSRSTGIPLILRPLRFWSSGLPRRLTV